MPRPRVAPRPILLVLAGLVAATVAAVGTSRLFPETPAVAAWLYLVIALLATLRWGRRAGLVVAFLAAALLAFVAADIFRTDHGVNRTDIGRTLVSIAGLIAAVLLTDRINRQRLAVERRLAELLGHALAQRQAHREREATLALLDTLLATAPVGFAFLDTQFRYRRINNMLAALNGAPPEAHLGRTPQEMVPALAAEVEPALERVMRTGQPAIDVELAGIAADDSGRQRHWLASYYPVQTPAGEMLGVGVVVADITERHHAERDRAARVAAEAGTAQLQAVLEAAPDAVMVTDQGGRILLINDTAERLFGYRRVDLAGRLIETLVPQPLWAAFQDYRVNCMADTWAPAANPGLEIAARRRDGSEFPAEFRCSRLSTADEPRTIVFVHDITARKQTEAALRDNEQRLRALFDQTFQFIGLLTPSGIVVEANATALDFVGCTRDEVIGRPFWETPWWPDVPQVRARVRAAVAEAAQGGLVRFETRHHGAGGAVVDVDFSLKPVRDATGDIVLLLPEGRDVTDHKRAEEERARLLRERTAMMESTSEGFFGVDLGGTCTFINEAAATLIGYTPEEVVGRNIHNLIHDRRPDGSPYPREECPLVRAMRTGQSARVDGEVLWHRNGTAIPVEYLAAPIVVDGEVVGGVGAYVDIAERKQAEAERERLLAREAEARQAAEAAMRTRDQFLSAITHDLGQPLTIIRVGAQMLQRYLTRLDTEDATAMAERVAVIDSAVTTAGAMVRELIDLARMQSGRSLDLIYRSVDLVALVRREVQALQQTTDRHHIALQTAEDQLVDIWDELRLTRVVSNLLANAVKYSPDGGNVVARLSRDADNDRKWAVLTVQDEGVGIPAVDQPRIFELFYRAGNVAAHIEGTGIGLAGAKQIVEQHGGTIGIASREGAGTTVTVRLPLDGVLPD